MVAVTVTPPGCSPFTYLLSTLSVVSVVMWLPCLPLRRTAAAVLIFVACCRPCCCCEDVCRADAGIVDMFSVLMLEGDITVVVRVGR